MNNPVLDLADWIEKQELEVKIDIAFLMSAHHPSFDFYNLPLDSNEMLEKFILKIRDFSGTELANVGFLVAFRAIFDFVFARKRGTEESWDEVKELLERVATKAPSVERSLSQLPERREKWISVCQDWKIFKDSVLSDKNIEQWENGNLIKRGPFSRSNTLSVD